MAAATAVLAPATMSCRATHGGGGTQKKTTQLVSVRGLNYYGGLKAHNSVVSLGLPACTEQSFAYVVSSLKKGGKRRSGAGGGALSSTCNAASEIFQIAAIMNGLVLIGVAVGFVLLRIEASVEEAE